MARTDCPNPKCGDATVSAKRIKLVVGRDRTIYYRLLLAIGVALGLFLSLGLFGRLLGLSARMIATGSLISIGALIVFFGIYNVFVRLVGIPAIRYRCSKCRYRWVDTDLRPDILSTMARKIEAELPRRRKRGNQRALAQVLTALGSLKLVQNDDIQGQHLHEESLALARSIGDKRSIACSLNDLGLMALFRGNHEYARTLLEECQDISRELGDWQLVAMPLNNLGLALLDCGDDQQADRLFTEAIGIQRKLGRKVSIAWSLAGLAEVALVRRQVARAATLCAAAEAVAEESGMPFMPGMLRRQSRTIAAARALLGEADFAAAWAEGRLMPQECAISYALDGQLEYV